MEASEVEDLAKMVNADVLAVRGKIAVFGARNRGRTITGAGPEKKQAEKKPTVRTKRRNSYLYH